MVLSLGHRTADPGPDGGKRGRRNPRKHGLNPQSSAIIRRDGATAGSTWGDEDPGDRSMRRRGPQRDRPGAQPDAAQGRARGRGGCACRVMREAAAARGRRRRAASTGSASVCRARSTRRPGRSRAPPTSPNGSSPFPLAATLSERLGTGVRLGNDVSVATEAELLLGAGVKRARCSAVFWGTGVGGGVRSTASSGTGAATPGRSATWW